MSDMEIIRHLRKKNFRLGYTLVGPYMIMNIDKLSVKKYKKIIKTLEK